MMLGLQGTAKPEPGGSPEGRADQPRGLPSLMSSCFPITLKFIDVSYRLKTEHEIRQSSSIKRIFTKGSTERGSTGTGDRPILVNITGMVSPGEILAILGPSGSGKSTLLNALAGRLNGPSLTGTILANNNKPGRLVAKRTGFVTQDDVLYPHLTVRETLVFCSLLRLPRTLSKEDRVGVADSVIAELGLGKCENTIIGNSFIRGISGGERKRVSIAHEMLVNPSLLILDEPTSGLDSTGAHRLVSTLGVLAQKGKTVVTSLHQPSSRLFQMFDKVLVLSEGRCLYFGKRSEGMAYFESVGFSPSFPMNPADFLLDLANGVCKLDVASERERPNVKQTLVAAYESILAPVVKAACLDTPTNPPKDLTLSNVNHSSVKHSRKTSGTLLAGLSSWLHQYNILLQRSLKERRHESFNSLRVFQVVTAALLAGIMWWHSDYREVQDRLGLLFFISIFWGVLPSFNAAFAFPQERAIFMKEHASGMYSLSSYFMARITGDLPMELILPMVSMTTIYWMAGLKPQIEAFVLTLLVLLGYVLVSQGLGLAVGAAIMDAKRASTIVTVTMLAFVLAGGYYVHKVPSCLAWLKYVSTTFYCYRLLVNVQYGNGEKISSVLGCSQPGSSDGARCKFVGQDIAGQISPAASAGVMFLMFVGYRVLAYIALKRNIRA